MSPHVFQLSNFSLSLLRIGLALLVLADLWLRFPYLEMYHTDLGVLPSAALSFTEKISFGYPISIHWISGSTSFQYALYSIHLVSGLALLIGYRCGVSAFICWFMLTSLQARNPLILNGGDVLLKLLLFWLIFLPSGHYISIDKSLRPQNGSGDNYYSLASCGLVLQLCLVYWVTVILKWSPEWTTEGTALEYALKYEPLVKNQGKYLLDYPEYLKYLTWGTMGLEILAPALILFAWRIKHVRTITCLAMVFFHLSTTPFFLLGLFPYVMMVAWIALLPTSFWRFIKKEDYKPQHTKHNLAQKIILVIAIILMLLSNLEAVLQSSKLTQKYPAFGIVQHLFQFRQRWDMFAPAPINSHWFMLKGILEDNSIIDLFTSQPFSEEKPKLVSEIFNDYHHEKYLAQLKREKYSNLRKFYAEYLCRSWNIPGSNHIRLNKIEFLVVEGNEGARKVLWQGECSKELRELRNS